MARFKQRLKAQLPKHKTYDETAGYINNIFSHMTPHEQENSSAMHQEVLTILKEAVRKNEKYCDVSYYFNCAITIGRYTDRIPALKPLHLPSSVSSHLGKFWDPMGINNPIPTDIAPSEKDIESVTQLYPESILRMFGGERKGAEAVARLPVLEVNNMDITEPLPKHMTSPVMRGTFRHGKPFLMFLHQNTKSTAEEVEVIFPVYANDPESWRGVKLNRMASICTKELDSTDVDYGRRLINGEPCGGRNNVISEQLGYSLTTLCARP